MQSIIHHRLTPSRLAWLQRLDRERLVDGRGKGRTGFDCMQLGWTEWALVQRDGHYVVVGEILTNAGRQQLRACQSCHN